MWHQSELHPPGEPRALSDQAVCAWAHIAAVAAFALMIWLMVITKM